MSKLSDISDQIVHLVALKIGDKDIITIKSYNKVSSKMQSQATTGFIVGGVMCLMFAAVFMLYHKRKIGKNKS